MIVKHKIYNHNDQNDFKFHLKIKSDKVEHDTDFEVLTKSGIVKANGHFEIKVMFHPTKIGTQDCTLKFCYEYFGNKIEIIHMTATCIPNNTALYSTKPTKTSIEGTKGRVHNKTKPKQTKKIVRTAHKLEESGQEIAEKKPSKKQDPVHIA
eukprot:UN27348